MVTLGGFHLDLKRSSKLKCRKPEGKLIAATKLGVNDDVVLISGRVTAANTPEGDARIAAPHSSQRHRRKRNRPHALPIIKSNASLRISNQTKLHPIVVKSRDTSEFTTRTLTYLSGEDKDLFQIKRQHTTFHLKHLNTLEDINANTNEVLSGDYYAGISSNSEDADIQGKHIKCAINEATNKLDLLSTKPYFSSWKIAGFKHDKIILSNLTNMEEKQEVTPEFVTYIKERDAALEEARKVTAEHQETQSKLYDAMKKIEELEKKVKDVETNNKATPKNAKKGNSNSVAKKNTKPTAQIKANSDSNGIRSERASVVVSSARADGTYHPPIDDIDPTADSCEYYWKVAEMFPTLPMYQILDAERKFIKADTDNSGSIDGDELDKVLTENITMFTKKQLDEIFAEVDVDKSNYIDFAEVLAVLNKLVARRKTNLPQSIQHNYSKTCSIQ